MERLCDLRGRRLVVQCPPSNRRGAYDLTLGYEVDLDAAMPRQKREVLFGRGELIRGILDTLREATTPMTSREVAQSVLSLTGHDARDRKLMTEHTRRVSKALRALKADRVVRGIADGRGNLVWLRSIEAHGPRK